MFLRNSHPRGGRWRGRRIAVSLYLASALRGYSLISPLLCARVAFFPMKLYVIDAKIDLWIRRVILNRKFVVALFRTVLVAICFVRSHSPVRADYEALFCVLTASTNIYNNIIFLCSGLTAELYYVREGQINDYALNFVVPVPATIGELHFTWQSLARRPVRINRLYLISENKYFLNPMAFKKVS